MGGCFSTQNKIKEEQGYENNLDYKALASKNSFSRLLEKNHGRGRISEKNAIKVIHPNLNDSGSSTHHYASGDENWFDSQSFLDSECDDDFCSINGDCIPQSSIMSDQSSSTQIVIQNIDCVKGILQNTYMENPVSEPHADVSHLSGRRMPMDAFSQKPTADERHNSETGSRQRVTDEGSENHGSSYHLSCLPRLLPTVNFNDKKAPVSPGLHKSRNSLLHLSFKRRSNELLDAANPFISKVYVENPVAGSLINFCSGHKPIEGTWSRVEPSTFKLRGPSYLRDKVKIFASEHSMYEPFGVDLFLSPKKISHIARYVELPSCRKFEDLPSLLILNIQIPMYSAALFLNEVDGEGLNLVLYHKLSDRHNKVPCYFKDMFLKVLDDGIERTRSFAGEFTVPFRERLKILGRVVNPEELHLSVPERKIVHTYNEKPVLSRPQHSFYQGDDYFEVDLDVHRFSYLARKGVESFRERLKLCILDLGLTIQGNKPDELPEHVLCCMRINKIDFTTCKHLSTGIN